MADEPDSIILEHLETIRADVKHLRNDNHDIKAALSIVRAYIADHNAEQNLLNSRLAAAELKIDRIEERLNLRDE